MNIPVASGNLIDQFARTLMTSLDINRDGQLSTSEFTTFLTKLAGEDLGTDSSTDPTQHEGPTQLEGPAPLLTGFDFGKLGNPSHTTVKYLFGRVAQRYSLTSVHDKASAEALLLQMRPDLEAAGLNVLDVSRDKLQIRDDEGRTVWFDVIRGATAGDPAFQWLDLPASNNGPRETD